MLTVLMIGHNISAIYAKQAFGHERASQDKEADFA